MFHSKVRCRPYQQSEKLIYSLFWSERPYFFFWQTFLHYPRLKTGLCHWPKPIGVKARCWHRTRKKLNKFRFFSEARQSKQKYDQFFNIFHQQPQANRRLTLFASKNYLAHRISFRSLLRIDNDYTFDMKAEFLIKS